MTTPRPRSPTGTRRTDNRRAHPDPRDLVRILTPETCQAARIAMGLTRKALAKRANLAAPTISDYERGLTTADPQTRYSIARVLAPAMPHIPAAT